MSGPPWGVVPTGFQAKVYGDIEADLESAFRTAFGQSIDLSPDGPYGQIIGILADRYAALWALGQAVYSAFDPDAASGAALVSLCALTGTIPLPALPSSDTLVLIGTNGTNVPGSSIVSVSGFPATKFLTQGTGAIATLGAWTISHSYAKGALVKNGGSVWYALNAGTSLGSGGGPSGGTTFNDNGISWYPCGAGTAAVAVSALCNVDGPTTALAGTLTVIGSPFSGWAAVINPVDATLGQLLETDAALRLRREVELRAPGSASVAAIIAALEEVDAGTVNGVTAVTVLENTTNATDGNGLVPHSIMALVTGGLDQDVGNALFASKAAGISTNGSTSVVVVDSQGISHTMTFQRPAAVPIYVVVNLNYLSGVYPTSAGGGTPGDTLVKEAIAAFGATFKNGQNVIASQLAAQVFGGGPNAVPGVIDVTSLYIGTAPAPGSATPITISVLDLATFTTANITVNSTPGTT